MQGIPINISFARALTTKPEKKCDCCDKLQKGSFMQYSSKITCQWILPEKAETIKVLFNKNKVMNHMETQRNELNDKRRALDKQELAKQKAVEHFYNGVILKSLGSAI
jgi:hypothetical protein